MEEHLGDMYQEVILDHNRKPRNFRAGKAANRHAHGVNPVCGDDYHLFLELKSDGVIADVSFMGKGCAISKASASMLTEAVKGRRKEEAFRLLGKFIELVTEDSCDKRCEPPLGSLELFEGVKKFPIRVKCATLIWRALEAALQDEKTETQVTTE